MRVAPHINGYYFPAQYVAGIARHNHQLAEAPESTTGLPRIATVFLPVPPICNLCCPYCYTNSSADSALPGLSSSELDNIFACAAEAGVRSVVVAGEGEPFMTPNIWGIIERATNRGLTCVIFTNGTCITEEVAHRLLVAGVSIILKLHSFNPSRQDALVGVPGAHKPIYAALNCLLAVGFRAPRLALQSAIMRPILEDLEEVFIFCREQDIVPYIETFVAVGRAATDSVRTQLEPTSDEIEEFFLKMQTLDMDRFGIGWPVSSRCRVVAYGACNKSQSAITVKSNGDIFRCVTESRRLGNIRQEGLTDILRRKNVVRALADQHCSGCSSVCLDRSATPRMGKAVEPKEYK